MKNEKQLATKKIEEITVKFNADMAELKAIIDKPDVVWPPEKRRKCFYINNDCEVHKTTWDNMSIDKNRLKQCRLHPTREQAEFYRDFLELESKRTVRFRLHEFAKRINDGWKADYGDSDQLKYTIFIDFRFSSIILEPLSLMKQNDLPVFKYDYAEELREEFTFEEIAMLFEVVG